MGGVWKESHESVTKTTNFITSKNNNNKTYSGWIGKEKDIKFWALKIVSELSNQTVVQSVG